MLAQSLIAVFGVAAIWLMGSADKRVQRWGPVCGLLAQPAWIWTTAVHEQWGILALTLFYTLAWVRGLRTYWSKA